MSDEPPLDLFPDRPGGRRAAQTPLADRMRPQTLEEFEGREALVGPRSLLGAAVESGVLPSLIFWGPPGSGKTTLARLLAKASGADFVAFSAVTSGVKEVREVIERARVARRATRHGDPPLRRRDPPLQQGPAGRVSASRGRRHGCSGRRHDGKPLLRGEQRAPVADEGHRASDAGAGVARADIAARDGGSRNGVWARPACRRRRRSWS